MEMEKKMNTKKIAAIGNVAEFENYSSEKKGKDSDWPDLIPIGAYSGLPNFPIETLDGIGQQMVKTTTEVAQVDSGLPGGLYLGVLSACTKFNIDLISHTEKSNLYLNTVAGSGERKSFVERVLSKPIYVFQKERAEEMKETIQASKTKKKLLEARLNNTLKKASVEIDPKKLTKITEDANILYSELQNTSVLKEPTYVMDDVTAEKLGVEMVENSERMAIISSEAGLFQLMAGYYNEKDANIDLYLKAFSGDPWCCHRIGRSTQRMENPTLSIAICSQPDVLNDLGKNKNFKGRGLLARFLYIICREQAGFRPRQLKFIPEALTQQYHNHVINLLKMRTDATLKMSVGGQAVWDEFYNDVEAEMRPGGSLEPIKHWGSKLPGGVASIAGLLHAAGGNAFDVSIDASTVAAAALLGGYFKEHAIAAFRIMGENKDIKSARKILDYIQRQNPGKFTGRDVLRHSFLTSMREVEPGIEILLRHNYIRVAGGDEYCGKGRPSAESYVVSPKLNIKEIH